MKSKLIALLVVALIAGITVALAIAGGYTDNSYLNMNGQVGVPYSHQIAWRDGQGCPPYSYHLDPGNALPPGLALNQTSGWITGTPTTAGQWTFYVSQIDLCGVEGQGNSPFTIKIAAGAAVTTSTTTTTPPPVTGPTLDATKKVMVDAALALEAKWKAEGRTQASINSTRVHIARVVLQTSDSYWRDHALQLKSLLAISP